MVEFPETEGGARLQERFAHLNIRAQPQVRRWCEWQLKKWGEGGAKEMVARLLDRAERQTQPAGFAVWCMKRRHEVRWMPDKEYLAFRRKYLRQASDYTGWVIDQSPEGLGSIEELVQRERKRLRAVRANPPPSVDW